MKIKRYLDKDMRHVLRRVREDQGPDAVILSNKRVEEGIEVIAAIDYDEALVRHAIGAPVDAESATASRIERETLLRIAEDDLPVPRAGAVSSNPSGRSGQDLLGASNSPSATARESSLDEMQIEIASMRSLLETQLSGLIWKDGAQRSPLRAQILRNLARLGIAPDIADRLIDRLEPVADVKRLWHAPLVALAQLLPVRNSELLEHGGTFALIGPTGVGKTTSIAKLAARFAMKNGADEIALVSADSYRIGAKEHLTAFANIIGAKVYSAGNPTELTDVLVRLRNKKLLLIDTEGRSPRDRDLANQLAAYGNSGERVKFLLTLSAATQESALDEAISCFRKVPVEGCIVTKIDEAAQLGCVASAMIRHDLHACWFSNGQRIPEDLYPAARRKMWFVNQAVECLEYARPGVDERTMANTYAAASVAHA